MAEAKAPQAPLKAYTSTQPVEQPAGVYNKPGEVFYSSAKKPGDGWQAVTPKEAAAIVAADPVPDDANLEAASKDALQAVAIMKHVNVAGLDKPALITAIKAAYEPKL